MIRKANINDVIPLQSLINTSAKEHLVLPRSLVQLYENLRDFFIVELDGQIIGCCALHVCWDNLAELKSLVLKDSYQGLGWGRKLVSAALAEAASLAIREVFVLTSLPAFFRNLGFNEIDKDTLPHKIWQECVNCVNYMDCNETPLLYRVPERS